MPKGARGSKGRRSPIEIGVKVIQVPKGVTRQEVLYAIRDATRRGTYDLPRGWIVQIGWRNNGGELRTDEFENAMVDSTQGGRGWDKLILRYVEMQLRKIRSN